MNRIAKVTAALCAALMLWNCTPSDDGGAGSLSVSMEEVVFMQNPAPAMLNVNAEAPWSATAPSWIRLEPSSGEAGNTMVTLTADGNPDSPARSGSIMFKTASASALVAVSQMGSAVVPDKVEIYRFLALEDDDASTWMLEGQVREIAPDESFLLVDRTGSVKVNALCKEGAKVLSTFGLADGDTLCVTAVRRWAGSTVWIDEAEYLSHRKLKGKGVVDTEIAALNMLSDYTPVRLHGTVCLAGTGGAILEDSGTFVYAEGDASALSMGDKVQVEGRKKKESYQRVVGSSFSVISDGEWTPPLATRYDQFSIDSYKSSTYVYAAVSGTLLGGEDGWMLDPGEVSSTKCSVSSDADLSQFDSLYVRVTGFVTGRKDGVLGLLASDVRLVQEGDGDGVLIVEWPVGTNTARNSYSSSWPKKGQIKADAGLLEFDHSGSEAAGTLSSNANKLDAPTSTSAYMRYAPRAYGTWEGDFFTFTGYESMYAGEKAEIYFEIAESANCMKYWYLEYLDGTDWRPALDVSVMDFNGRDVKYTTVFETDKQNIPVTAKVTFLHDTPDIVFRFTAVSTVSIAGVTRYPVGTDGVDEDLQGATGWLQLVCTKLDTATYTHPKILKYQND